MPAVFCSYTQQPAFSHFTLTHDQPADPSNRRKLSDLSQAPLSQEWGEFASSGICFH